MKVQIILDSMEYKSKESEYQEYLSDICDVSFLYTEYENKTIEFFHKIPAIGSLLTHVTYWTLSLLYALNIILRTKNAECIIFINPIVGFFYSLISRFTNSKKTICIAGFLFEPKSNSVYYNIRKYIVNFAYKETNKIIVYGKDEITYYKKIFPSLSEKFIFIKYGRDFIYKDNRDFNNEYSYISSGGRSNRDYATYINAMSIISTKENKIKGIIATRPECVKGLKRPNNLNIKYNITLNQFGSFLDKSLFCVLPLIDTNISAGHMALFEAMFHKKIIIVADIPAIRNYVNNDQVIFYKPNDSIDLSKKIIFVYNNIQNNKILMKAESAHIFYENNLSFKAMLYRIVKAMLYV